MQWNLHITGESAETDLVDAIQTFTEDLERIGHTLNSATLTTDSGQTDLPTAPSADATAESVVEVDTPPALPDS